MDSKELFERVALLNRPRLREKITVMNHHL